MTAIDRRVALQLLIAAVSATAAKAQSYPERPVRLVVPFAPGGGGDIIGRIVAQRFSEKWGVSMFVENKSGASGNLGTEFVARSAPNGETLLITPNGLTVNPSFMNAVSYDATNDLVPVGMVAASSLVLAVNRAVPAKDLRELIALAKRQPGKLNYGSTGIGTTPHVAGELVNIVADIKTEHIPYRSSGAIIQALLAGEVQIGYVSYNAVEGFVRDGAIRLLATIASTRDPALPDLPTMAESGLPDCEVDVWYAMFAPAKTPDALVRKLNSDLRAILEAPGMADFLMQRGFNPAYSTPEALANVVAKDLAKWKLVSERIGFKKI